MIDFGMFNCIPVKHWPGVHVALLIRFFFLFVNLYTLDWCFIVKKKKGDRSLLFVKKEPYPRFSFSTKNPEKEISDNGWMGCLCFWWLKEIWKSSGLVGKTCITMMIDSLFFPLHCLAEKEMDGGTEIKICHIDVHWHHRMDCYAVSSVYKDDRLRPLLLAL